MNDEGKEGTRCHNTGTVERAEHAFERIRQQPPQGEKEERIRSLLRQIEIEMNRSDKFYPVYRRVGRYIWALLLIFVGLVVLNRTLASPLITALGIICFVLLIGVAENGEFIATQAIRYERNRIVRQLFIPKELR